MIAGASRDKQERYANPQEPELVELAERLFGPVRLLLDLFAAPMLTVAVSAARVTVALWTRDLIIAPDLTDAVAARHDLAVALNDTRLHGGAVCAVLARRWPVNATPPVVGIVTDGFGMAISGGHPCALTPAWLVDHVAGHATVDMIVPFGRSAALHIAPATSAARRH